MKKIYMMPSVKVKEIKPTTILEGSLTEGANPIQGGKIDGASGIASKESFGFEDDIESEEDF